MEQQKQPTNPDTKTGMGTQSTQPQQQKSNILADEENKQVKPAGGYQSPPKEGEIPAKEDRKTL